MFQINDKVVCVDDSVSCQTGEKLLCNGVVYVVDGTDGVPDKTGGDGIFLVGIRRLPMGWRASRFRKLSDIKAENAVKRAEVRHA